MPADFYKMANLPTWNTVEIEAVGGETLSAAFERGAEGYEQVVDISDGSLTTRYRVRLGEPDLHAPRNHFGWCLTSCPNCHLREYSTINVALWANGADDLWHLNSQEDNGYRKHETI